MNCPRCESHPLDPVAVDQTVRVDWCSRCGGAFYAAGELRAVLGSAPTGQGTKPGVRCPSCQTTMVEQRWPASGTVRIDGCPGCEGHWLDKGELVRLRQSLDEDRRAAAVARTGPTAHIPVHRLAAPLRTLQWPWVAGGAIIMLLSFATILGLLDFFRLLEALRDRQISGGQITALWALVLAYPVGGLLIGRGSSGFTVWEAAIASIPTTIAMGWLVASFSWLQTLGLVLVGFVLALLGAVAGERLSGR